MSADILARLEAVAARLESYAHAVASGSVSSSSSGAAASGGVPREVEDYDQFYNEHVVPFVNTAKKSKETEAIGGWAERAWGFVRTAIFASKQSKKPADAALAKFVEPLSAVISETQKPNRTIPANHAKAFGDAVVSTSWFTQGGNARAFAQDQLEQADFWLIKILKEGKDSGKADFTEFAQKLKVLLQKQVEFIGDNYRAGLEWNPKGADLSAFSGAGAPAAAAPASGAPAPPPGPPGDYFAPDAPPGPPPPGDYSSSAPAKPSTAAGLGAVFAELTSKGDGVTKGLTKVTKDMKNALKAAPVLEAKKKEDVAPAKKWGATAAKVEEKKEPRLHLAKGTWFCEHYENTEVTIPDVELKENVYILKCKNTTISIPNKCKSIQVDGSVKTHVQFKSVVSLAEIFNSQRVVLDCIETLPSVAVDKSQGCQIWLSRQGVAAPPEIITSSVSELNLQVPGKTDEDDPIEIALPEQYITKYKGGTTLVTEPVTHGSNG